MKVLIFYSGGKDSQAALLKSIGVYGLQNCEAVFCDTGWENPVTYEHIKKTCLEIGQKPVVLKSKKYNGMVDLAIKKQRFPSTKARFCTQELKVKPTIDYVLSKKEHLIIIEGIRKNESVARQKMDDSCDYFKHYFSPYGFDKKGKPKYFTYRKDEVKEWVAQYSASKLRPIFEWTAEQTIDFILQKGQTPNPLYYQGFKRVGCFPCIMANHGECRRIIDNFPEHWDELKQIEQTVGSTFFPPNYIPRWARISQIKNGQKFCTASDVEQYLKNKNATGDAFEDDMIGCVSAYNLCE